MLFGILGWFRLGGLVVIAGLVYFAYANVQSVITRYTNMSGEITALTKENKLLKSRLDSYNLRISRRDDAINASKCKDQINKWVRHPDDIPQPFNPFNQLNSGN